MLRHRLFGVSAVVPVLAGLLLAVPARAAEVEKLLPNDTEVVLTINVKQIVSAPLVKKLPLDKLQDQVKVPPEVEKILKDLGFDPDRDLDSITFAVSSGSEPDKGLLIVHGTFDVAKFRAKAEEVAKDKPDVIKIRKVPDGAGGEMPLYEVTMPNPNGPQTLYAAIASKNTIVASAGKDYVLDAIDKEAGKRKTNLKNKDLQALLGRVESKQSIWLALLGSTLAKSQLASSDEAKQFIDKLQDAILGLTIDKDLTLHLSATAKNPDDAKDLDEKIKESLNTVLGLAAIAAAQNKELNPIVDLLKSVKPSRKDKVVIVEIEVPGDKIEKAIKQGRD